MILRKPYAFLIKQFKKIHLLLAILMIYSAYRTTHLLTYLNKYISEGWLLHSDIKASNYINFILILVILIIIGISSVIFILMHVKKKPKKLYIFIPIFYVASLIVFFLAYTNLNTIVHEIIDPRTIRLTRDLTFAVSAIEYIIIVLVMIRALGFNIKKFNFSEDVNALNISETDYEEVELTIGVDTRGFRQKLRRKQREIRYFILENITKLIVLSVLIVIIIGTSIYLNYEVYNKIYKEKEIINITDFTIRIDETYSTDKNYKGIVIAPKNNTYIIINVSLKNNTNSNNKINVKDFELLTYDGKYYPVLNRYKSFFDLGIGYNNQTIKANTTNKYILIFEVPTEVLNNDIILKYTDLLMPVTRYNQNTKNKMIKINPINISKQEKKETKKLGETLDLNASTLKNSNLTIDSIDISDKFEYTYKVCSNECSEKKGVILPNFLSENDKTILKIKGKFNLDSTISNDQLNDMYSFIDNFVNITYVLNDKYKHYITSYVNLTPNNDIEGNTYIEVPEELKTATNIELVIVIRNKTYKYILRGE